MTADEWLACTDPQRMLNCLQTRGTASERKLRLFAATCCRRLWRWLPDERSQKALEVAERLAEGLATEQERQVAEVAAAGAFHEADIASLALDATDKRLADYFNGLAAAAAAGVVWAALSVAPSKAATGAASEGALAAAWAADAEDRLDGVPRAWGGIDIVEEERKEEAEQCRLLRCIFGPLPVLRLPLAPSVLAWNDRCLVRLAQGIYEERAFTADRLGVLADALEDAGCIDADVIDHCRRPGEHARGCWVVDLVLERP